uniref:lipoprotein N-acyltransferase Lnb domain-containing protein n=1 Tax=Flavobacterium sp. TaxID=239 RepID=UPI00404B563A
MHKKILLLFLFTVSACFSQKIGLTENAKVSVLTVGTGNASHELYGHTGIRIKDTARGIDVVYNYGFFDFNTPYFVAKFVKGDMQYYVANQNYPNFEYGYKMDNRSIYEQEIALTLDQKNTLFQNLNASLFSEERFYTYKFIDRNCTTKVIDQLNAVLGEAVITTTKPVTITYRDILNNTYLDHDYFTKLGINLIFGTKVDHTAETLFLPLELHSVLQTVTYQNKPLTTSSKTIFEAKKIPLEPSLFNSPYLIILLLALIVLINNKRLTSIYFIISGLLGVFLLLVGLYSYHEEVFWNYNAVLFNPILLFFTFSIFKRGAKNIINTGKIYLGCLIVYLLFILNKVDLMLFLPFIIANFILVTRIVLSCKKGNRD